MAQPSSECTCLVVVIEAQRLVAATRFARIPATYLTRDNTHRVACQRAFATPQLHSAHRNQRALCRDWSEA